MHSVYTLEKTKIRIQTCLYEESIPNVNGWIYNRINQVNCLGGNGWLRKSTYICALSVYLMKLFH